MDLRPWGAPPVTERLGGGHRNEVYRAGDRVVRRSRRSAPSLEWELELLDHLSLNGFLVPEVVRTHDGRRHVHGIVVQEWLPGREPEEADWPSVAAELRRLHSLMATWPPRPDGPGTCDLLTTDRGGDVDLTSMPREAVAACRAAWAALDGPKTVVHGDPCAANIRIQEDGTVGLLDWDDARVDHPWLDLADLPCLDPPREARAAVDAWEAANAWFMEPTYARGRLAGVPVDKPVDN
ncbi:phosphotransferase enzyme family protein [Actinophytocola oryzae]|uniref:Phosphotransferase family enzyme n=1 Tax=Actinophytocola oryzae TaxID=502181 RepID=A0A4V3FTE5_9PSEU|nr:phosphotransferase [Actinophytocola oryzae]TDV51021.1 phosphotransferase family enzyme [Actinophytocola oryzae]